MIRKAIYSQWSRPHKSTTSNFFSREVAEACWFLSVERSKKYFDSVELICDEESKKTIVDDFGIKFDKVHNVLDKELQDINETFWIMGKMYAYKMQTEPFMHIDSDFIFFDKIQNEMLDSPFLFSNPETIGPLYKTAMKILEKCPCKPKYYDPTLCVDDICCVGIFGVNDLTTMQEWVESIFQIITCKQNCSFWSSINSLHQHVICWLLEQYMISNLIKTRKIKPVFLSDSFKSWTHLLGGDKRNESIAKMVLGRYRFEKHFALKK